MDFLTSTDIRAYQTIAPMAQPPSQYSLPQVVSQASGIACLVVVLVIGCFYFEHWCQKQGGQRASRRRQQIESLERIWRMKTYQRP